MGSLSLNPKKGFVRSFSLKQALVFGGRAEADEKTFKRKYRTMFDLFWLGVQESNDNSSDMKAAAEANRMALADLVARADTDPTGIWDRRTLSGGRADLNRYRVAPKHGSYVVFSDMHMTQDAHRQNFFASSGLKALYLDILQYYYAPEGFALVENGDVEELLIYEPDLDTLPKFNKHHWDDILADRQARKAAQFEAILTDHADYYRLVADQFIARDAYYRTIGNHDYDLADTGFADRIKARLGIDWPTASDLVLLADKGGVTEILCHGHQFDESCTQPFAPKVGESISQGNAWAFQGADRNWSTAKDGKDFLAPWRAGDRDLPNTAVDAETDDLGFFDTISVLLDVIGKSLTPPSDWEDLLSHQIAWEYFLHPDDGEAVLQDEILTGDRYYKFRHLSEAALVKALEKQFPDGVPRVTLGHSHEPRVRSGRTEIDPPVSDRATLFMTDEAAAEIDALRPDPPDKRVEGYLNAGSAGRFQDLLWGIEFVDGVAELVSWSRAEDGQSLLRTRWNDAASGGKVVLRAGHVSTHAAETPPAGPPMAAILNLLVL